LLWDAKEASVRKQKDLGELILFDHRLFLEEEGDGGWSNNHLCKYKKHAGQLHIRLLV